jgi:hypothetical protein
LSNTLKDLVCRNCTNSVDESVVGLKRVFVLLLTTDKKTVVAEERLGIMAKTSNGFIIAEKISRYADQESYLEPNRRACLNFASAIWSRSVDPRKGARRG